MTAEAPEPTPLNAGRPGHVSEIVGAFRGVVALMAANERWTRAFDLTPGGFIRSFFGPALALPLYVVGAALVAHATATTAGAAVPTGVVISSALAHVLDAVGFPVVIALMAQPLKLQGGFGAFIIVTNWANLFLNALLTVVSALALLGEDGAQVFVALGAAILCVWIFVIWRAARTTLTKEIAPVLLVVVTAVAIGAVADKLGELAVVAMGFKLA